MIVFKEINRRRFLGTMVASGCSMIAIPTFSAAPPASFINNKIVFSDPSNIFSTQFSEALTVNEGKSIRIDQDSLVLTRALIAEQETSEQAPIYGMTNYSDFILISSYLEEKGYRVTHQIQHKIQYQRNKTSIDHHVVQSQYPQSYWTLLESKSQRNFSASLASLYLKSPLYNSSTIDIYHHTSQYRDTMTSWMLTNHRPS